jgi:transcriptional regulator with XRE-family HTH domain
MANIPEECRCPKLFETIDKLDMSQKEFADKIGASTGNVSDWLKGRASPTRRRWAKISEVLGIPVEELMGTKKEPAGQGGLDEQMQMIVDLLNGATQEERDAVETLLKSKVKKD